LLTASIIIAAYLLDRSLKNPTMAAEVIGLPVIGVLSYPNITKRRQSLMRAQNSEQQLGKRVLLALHQKPLDSGPMVVGLLSSYSGEGKTYVANVLVEQLNDYGIRNIVLTPHGYTEGLKENYRTTIYDPLDAVSPGNMLPELQDAAKRNAEVIIIEFPPLLEQAYPVSLLQQLDLALVVTRMGRTWQKSDNLTIEAIRKITKANLQVVLTNARIEFVKEYNGIHSQPIDIASVQSQQKRDRPKAEEYVVPEGF
jgi:hypothetical protein